MIQAAKEAKEYSKVKLFNWCYCPTSLDRKELKIWVST